VLFDSGEAEISPRGQEILMRVGQVLSKIDDKQIQVSGHTDDAAISDKLVAKFPTNWELSSARAVNVVRFLNEEAKVPGRRLVASGYGPFHPISSNATPQGRARNRRIEILLTPVIESVKDRELAAQVAAVKVPPASGSAPAHKAAVAKAVKPAPKVVPAKAIRPTTHLTGKRTTTTANHRR
jgi:chemotaxis protein MotB